MKPVFQTRHGRDGNCTQACIASLLELPLEACPDPAPYWADDADPQLGWDLLDLFFEKLGLLLVQQPVAVWGAERPKGYWIATTDQGTTTHASVWLHDQLVHDPDTGPAELGPVIYVNSLVVLDPVKVGQGIWRLRGEHS